jgi:intracellular multiplication protein IcmD
MKKLMVSLLLLIGVCGSVVFAASGPNLGTVAANVTGTLANVAKLVTALSYVLGLSLAIVAIMKFKAHKEAPTQVPLSTAVFLLLVSILLIFAPTVFQLSGATLFAGSGKVAGVSGITSFGAPKAGS